MSHTTTVEVDFPVIPCTYYDPHELNDITRLDNNLLVFHYNIRSYGKNEDNLLLLLRQIDHVIDVIVLTETWFAEGLSGEISGFTGHHMYWTERAGGCVSIFVRSGLEFTVITHYCSISDICEVCAVEKIPASMTLNKTVSY